MAESMDQALEQDMARLTFEVQKHVENPENRSLSSPEILKKSIQTYTETTPSQVSGGNLGGQAAPNSPLPAYTQSVPPATQLQIEQLVDLALHQGILKADAAAKSMSPFVVDAFHDALTGKLYPEFQRRGILK